MVPATIKEPHNFPGLSVFRTFTELSSIFCNRNETRAPSSMLQFHRQNAEEDIKSNVIDEHTRDRFRSTF